MNRDLFELPPSPAELRIRYGEDINQFFDVWKPPRARAVLMMIHGGYWRAKYDLLHTSHFCSAMAKSGLAVANLEYRRVGNRDGGWPGTYDDVLDGFAAVQRYFGADKKYLVIGHSAGGQLALRLAVDAKNLKGVMALAPVAVLRTAFELQLSNDAVVEFLGGVPADIPEIYDDACPSKHAAKVQRILLHGTADEDVPIVLSQEFEAARQNDPGTVWFMKLDECDHFDLIDPESRAWPIIHMDVESLLED